MDWISKVAARSKQKSQSPHTTWFLLFFKKTHQLHCISLCLICTVILAMAFNVGTSSQVMKEALHLNSARLTVQSKPREGSEPSVTSDQQRLAWSLRGWEAKRMIMIDSNEVWGKIKMKSWTLQVMYTDSSHMGNKIYGK